MTNMFSGNREKKIPKTFKDCYKSDNITVNLWIWCERLEKWGGIFCIILGIVGIFSIISDGIQAAEMIDKIESTYNIDPRLIIQSESVFEVVIDGILRWSFYCFLEYCAYHVLALFVGSLATIVQHTKITANINLLSYAQENNIEESLDEEIKEENEESSEIKDDEKIIEKFYKVKLIDDGNDPILIRNEISKLSNITLSDANKVVNLIPNAIFKFKSFEAANELCIKLRSLGATVELIGLDESDVEINQDNGKYEKIQCPYCFENLEFLKGTKNAQCPYCNKNFTINT